VASARRFAVYGGLSGYATRAGMHRGRRLAGARRRNLYGRKRRRVALAGSNWSVYLSAARRSECAGNCETGMKKLIVFDLDGTLAESKSPLDAEMSRLLSDLLAIVKVAVISGGDWRQFEEQVLTHLPHDQSLANLSLLPTCGTNSRRTKKRRSSVP
jgi:hypothetical protein